MFCYSLDGEQIFCQSWLTICFFLLCCCGRPLASVKHKTQYYDPTHLSNLPAVEVANSLKTLNLFQVVQTQTTARASDILALTCLLRTQWNRKINIPCAELNTAKRQRTNNDSLLNVIKPNIQVRPRTGKITTAVFTPVLTFPIFACCLTV